jgi:hypothetical protein
MTKIVIEVTDSGISSVTSNEDVEYVIVDYSAKINKNEITISEILHPDMVMATGTLSDIFPTNINNKLKQLNF